MRNYKRYTNEDLAKAVKENYSYAAILRQLNLIPAGGNYKHLQKRIQELKLDCSHMTYQAHNKNKEVVPFDELKGTSQIKKRIIKERGWCCEGCGLHTWMQTTIPLELEHIDGNGFNNDRSNLKLLCPNCHALTTTWRRRKD